MGVMAGSGVESVRANIFWDATEPAPGVYDWSEGIARAFWYSWASGYTTKGKLLTTPTFQYSGLTRWSQGRPFVSLPLLAAYRRVAEKYEGCRKSANAHVCG
jgi:hypothetical protein